MRGKMDCFGRTDIGCKRDSNQDQFLIADLLKSIVIHRSSLGYDDETQFSGDSRAKLLMVADGMGGYEGGERASWLAIEGVVQYLLTSLHWPITCPASHEAHFFQGLQSALDFSQSRLLSAAAEHPSRDHMGTTLTMAWIVWPTVYLIHVGDSRAYLFRDGRLTLWSHDQTLAQAMADNGVIESSEVETSRFRHVLTSALGCKTNMEPQYGRNELRPNDKLLICSDGLTVHLTDEEIAEQLAEDLSTEDICDRLIDSAKQAGGQDNITVVLAHFVPNPAESESRGSDLEDTDCESVI